MLKPAFILYISFTFLFSFAFANPWGKDADLAIKPKVCTPPPPSPSLLARLGEGAVRFHQVVISPIDGPRSHFLPSSSQYTIDAMRKYGFFRGYIKGCDRLLRENNDPWVYKKIIGPDGMELKLDPVN